MRADNATRAAAKAAHPCGAARQLGIHRQLLYSTIKQYGLDE
jgi:transcriptional regulator of acetoin/glycerol metabolism